MEYEFRENEAKWQKYWADHKTFAAAKDKTKPKYYILDMFPYPSGAGLHVGHPLGYIASDIVTRYKRMQGFNVLHPMGYDSFGLPAEQYAIQTGQHPAITTEQNINRYREQLDKVGFSFDWDREVRTSDPAYYKWTQWIFMQLFNSWYNKDTDKAENLASLISIFEQNGNANVKAVCSETEQFSSEEWKNYSEEQKQIILLNYRLAYLSDTMVNWCPQLGTVLANEEVKDGLSERGGYPVIRKEMKQWSLRIIAYADRLLEGLDRIDWPEPIKEMQRNWIGKSEGSTIRFQLKDHAEAIEVFTTRPDTIYGVSYMTLAPEHELVKKICTADRKATVEAYIDIAANRSERDRMADVKTISGEFTGAYVVHPFTGKDIPVWIGDYVLAGYGTGAVMAVPGHDTRDYAFAKHFDLPILEVVSGGDLSVEAYDAKQGAMVNSDFLNGLEVYDAIKAAIAKIEEKEIGKGTIQYRLRDAIFSRQRYWGEPIPVKFKNGIPELLAEDKLPLKLPEVDAYLPTESGEPPLARAKNWMSDDGFALEASTMPGWAGSSWYFLRYMDAKNEHEFAAKEELNYWQNVDLYIGGAEHATGHLLYVRFWTKFLFDLGMIPKDEMAKKLINQGMIQGVSCFAHRIQGENKYVSFNLIKDQKTTAIHIDVNLVENGVMDIEAVKAWKPDMANAEFILEDGKFICGHEVEKMSKSKYNVVSPDVIIEQHGADTLRMYEMFLGPLELGKPWNTNGIEGVSKFIRRVWRLFHDATGNLIIDESDATKDELRTLHKTIKKITEDIDRFSFNTCISTFMICVNELTEMKCHKRSVIEPLVLILAPFAPHLCEELWSILGHKESISAAPFPKYNEAYLVQSSFEYPISINGKTRTKMELDLGLNNQQIETAVLESDEVQKFLEGKQPKKVIIVPGRIVNLVI